MVVQEVDPEAGSAAVAAAAEKTEVRAVSAAGTMEAEAIWAVE